jgi:hypothetical protein
VPLRLQGRPPAATAEVVGVGRAGKVIPHRVAERACADCSGSSRSMALGRVFIVCTILLGTVIRLVHLAFIDVTLPFRLGGLFLEFAEQIAASGYSLPHRIPFYTDGGLPFAYPPLPFYVEAVLLDLLSLPKFLVVNLLPPAIAVLCLPSFAFLTHRLGLGPCARLTALLAYATLPTAFWEQIEAGGLAEASGSLALIWLAIALTWAERRETVRRYAVLGLFWAASVLASPGSAYASALMVAMFAVLQLGRAGWPPQFRTIGLLVLSGGVAVTVSAPYWLTVVANHGVAVFQDSVGAQTTGTRAETLQSLLFLDILQPATLRIHHFWYVLTLVGAVWAVFHARWGFVAWLVALASVPREGAWMSALPGAILAGIGGSELSHMVAKYLRNMRSHKSYKVVTVLGMSSFLCANIIAVPIWCILQLVNTDLPNGEKQLQYGAMTAMDWARENTPVNARFVILSAGEVEEWFPQLARRTVINESYGTEWEPKKAAVIGELQNRLAACIDFDCISVSVKEVMGFEEVYLYVDAVQLSKLRPASERGAAGKSVFRPIWENSTGRIGVLVLLSH